MRYQVKPEPALLTFISTWESVALTTGRIPTWTTLVHKLPRGARFCVVAVASVYLAVHFHALRDPIAPVIPLRPDTSISGGT